LAFHLSLIHHHVIQWPIDLIHQGQSLQDQHQQLLRRIIVILEGCFRIISLRVHIDVQAFIFMFILILINQLIIQLLTRHQR